MVPVAVGYNGKRLNSPNDLVFDDQGALYFTDPPFGLPGTFTDPDKELEFNAVFRVAKDGKITRWPRSSRLRMAWGSRPTTRLFTSPMHARIHPSGKRMQ